MFRLQTTTIGITSRDLNDAERRSRYRKHLLNRRRTNRRRDHHTLSEQEATTFEDALNRRVATPMLEPIAEPGTRASPSRYATEGEEDTDLPPLLLEDETDYSYDPTLDLDADHRSNPSAIEPEQHRTSLRSRSGSIANRGIAIGPLPIRTRFDNTDNRETEQHEAEYQLASYDSEDESTDNHSQHSTELADFFRDPETTNSAIAEELDDTSSLRHLPVYSDRLPSQEQPQTPRQLPEARHQSRFDGAYTAPSRGRRRLREDLDDAPVTVRRTRGGYSTSPVGLRTPGFQGLYGGSENADDA
ncbi:Ff.00g051100.m01.CDS01 [Fusarium sp. VM40]|nr:Ff.00g051100.m01.CDS01 [Fusarium sp. VM40]